MAGLDLNIELRASQAHRASRQTVCTGCLFPRSVGLWARIGWIGETAGDLGTAGESQKVNFE